MTDQQKENLQQYRDNFVKYRLELIDRLHEEENKLDLTDQSQVYVYGILNGFKLSLVRSIKTVKDFLQEVFDYDLELPESFEKHENSLRELFYLDDDKNLFSNNDVEINDFITRMKQAKYSKDVGQQDNRQDETGSDSESDSRS